VIRRLWILLMWNWVGQPRREEAERIARARLMVKPLIAPVAEARIRKRWAGAIRPRFAIVRKEVN